MTTHSAACSDAAQSSPATCQIAGVNAALVALDSIPIEVEAAARAVVSDDGRRIRLTLYADAGAIAAVVLDPVRAVALAQRLIAAALARLSSITR